MLRRYVADEVHHASRTPARPFARRRRTGGDDPGRCAAAAECPPRRPDRAHHHHRRERPRPHPITVRPRSYPRRRHRSRCRASASSWITRSAPTYNWLAPTSSWDPNGIHRFRCRCRSSCRATIRTLSVLSWTGRERLRRQPLHLRNDRIAHLRRCRPSVVPADAMSAVRRPLSSAAAIAFSIRSASLIIPNE